jgi:hypothetical protein
MTTSDGPDWPTVSVRCSLALAEQPNPEHRAPREIRRYERTPQGWQLQVFRLLGGTRRTSSDGTRAFMEPIPAWMPEQESDSDRSRKLVCTCGLSLPIREQDLYGYLEDVYRSGCDEVELRLLIVMHQRATARRHSD